MSGCPNDEEPIGACCDGTACSLVGEANCGGLFVDGLCDPNPCPSVGACCMVGGDCALTTQFDCDRGFLGAGTECNMCPTNAACCDEENVCREVETPDECDGRPILGEICDPNPCDQAGGCCLSDGSCIEVDSPDCDGLYVSSMGGAGPTCEANTCNGACCDDENQCTIRSVADCGGNDFIGPRTSCDPDPCDSPIGACCRVEGCVEAFRTDCEVLFISGVTCDPDPCPIPIELTQICAGVTQNQGVSLLAWSFAVESAMPLVGETLALGIEGPGDPFTAEGDVNEEGLVRIENVAVETLGTYTYEVLSVGSGALAGDLNGSIVVDGSDIPCLEGAGGAGGSGVVNSYAGCVERPLGSVECACDPFNDNCSGNTNCSTNFFFDPATGDITGVPALDGSDGAPATECVSDVTQVVGEGGPCNVSAAATQRFDDCLPGLFCDETSGFVCVPLCVAGRACTNDNCEFFRLNDPEIGPLGRCTIP